jgi:hypothetical protein
MAIVRRCGIEPFEMRRRLLAESDAHFLGPYLVGRHDDHESVLALVELTVKRGCIAGLIAQGLRRTAEAFGIKHRAVHMHGWALTIRTSGASLCPCVRAR